MFDLQFLYSANSGVGVGRCTGDYLEISDGSSTQRYCGTSTPAPLTTTNTITVKLHLVDYDVSGTGFLATACCSVAVTTDVSTGEWRVETIQVLDRISYYQAPPPRVSSSLLRMDSIETRIAGR